MRALTVKQPWSAAIAHGPKRIENRSRSIPAQHVGSTILIHAGQDYSPVGRITVLDVFDQEPEDLWPEHRGAIVAVATLANCHQDEGCCRPWGFPDAWHWQLTDVRAVPHPILGVRGQLGLWTVPDDVLAAVQRQVYLPERSAQ
ncbi:ASCH domain-containing protein [Streptomyces achromogenes]|uniref:ASCH domain-containing protein n=1 Tax=Streptomyces achromogenes TaxID=67255 RepID=UPI003A803A86